MKELEYPFDADYIIKKYKSLKRMLLADGFCRIDIKIAVLGGSTTQDVVKMLELFLLNEGIRPVFYESEFDQYWQDIMFRNEDLKKFSPDVIYIHTSSRNIKCFPSVKNTEEEIYSMSDEIYNHFEVMWKRIEEDYGCPIIQNNFEPPFFRLFGNSDVYDIHGRLNYINQLNMKFYKYAQENQKFYINDINYMASLYGLQKWADPYYWHLYKYACTLQAIPELAFNLSNIIKSMYGRNKKAVVLDLDNTLWGGIVGDDGVENIEIGQETPKGQIYSEFQEYLKNYHTLGVLLAVNSKNDKANALAGLSRPGNILHPEDFQVIKTNWEPKDKNLVEIAKELDIGDNSLVFVDDNPAERHMVKSQVPSSAVPEIGMPEDYIRILDRSGFFEVTSISQDDIERNKMYTANAERKKYKAYFEDYNEYLESLNMTAEIKGFCPDYYSRIAQLTNKSNQFNLTSIRYSQSEIESFANDSRYITLYGRLKDRFGDNGVVSVMTGYINESKEVLEINLWLMSCRVLKRNMEYAMMDKLVEACKEKCIKKILGYYYPTAKNGMVKELYGELGFIRTAIDEYGNSVWSLDVSSYINKNHVIIME